MAKTFIPNVNNEPTVDHIDRNKQNNEVSNLRWASYVEQANNKDKTNIIKKMKKLYAKALLTYIGHATATGLAVGAASVIMDYFSRPKKVQMEEGFWY